MSGPIVRTGTTPKFWENYDRVFGGKGGAKKKSASKSAAKAKSGKSTKAKAGAAKKAKKK